MENKKREEEKYLAKKRVKRRHWEQVMDGSLADKGLGAEVER